MDKKVYFLLLIQVASSLAVQGDENQTLDVPLQLTHEYQCPTLFFYNTETEQCECYSSSSIDDIVKCSYPERGALLKYGYCMTHNKGGTFVGRCQYFEIKGHNISERPGFIILPDNVSELNEYMCGPMNRKGLVCSECIEGFGPSVTSLGHTCSNCTDAWYGIPLFLFIEFVPITIFYVLVIIFQISLTSAPFTAFVLCSQFAVSGFTTTFGRFSFSTSFEYYLFIILVTFYGIWNLDFFRYIFPPFCVSPNLNVISIVFLGYISAFYPLCLIGLTWVCIKIHSYDFKIFTLIGNKIPRCFTKLLHLNKDSNNTVIDVFSTFLLLSYTKLVVIFVATIEPDLVINISDHSTQRVLSSDPSVKWCGTENLPFLIISFIILFVLILPPIILLTFYPTKVFQSLLSTCSSGRHSRPLLALNCFVEKFNSSYRNGLNGGRDMRGFASLYFLLRILIYLTSISEHFLLYNALILGAIGFLIAIVRPYKKTYMNVYDSLILANMAFICTLVYVSNQQPFGYKTTLAYKVIAIIAGSLPILGFLGLLLYKTVLFRWLFARVKKKIRVRQVFSPVDSNINNENTWENVRENNPELPDRVLNPECYDGEMATY